MKSRSESSSSLEESAEEEKKAKDTAKDEDESLKEIVADDEDFFEEVREECEALKSCVTLLRNILHIPNAVAGRGCHVSTVEKHCVVESIPTTYNCDFSWLGRCKPDGRKRRRQPQPS